jgi:hypothetical protein
MLNYRVVVRYDFFGIKVLKMPVTSNYFSFHYIIFHKSALLIF